MLHGFKYGPAVDWWSLGIAMYRMMVGQHPFLFPKMRPYSEKILKNRVVYPLKLSWSAVSILHGVSIFNTKTGALQLLEFSVFPHLVTLNSHRVNIKKMCVSGLREDYACFGFCLFDFGSMFL